MLLPMLNPTRQCPMILRCGILFAVSSQYAAGAADVSISEVLIIGTPVPHDLATRKVTITIAYKPTLAPGVSSYGLFGCYGHTGVDQRGGHPFGTERDYATPSSLDLKTLTVATCLDACATVSRQSKTEERFGFAGIKNGSECYCFRKVDKNAVELSANNCTTACPGDPKLSCGGPDALVIYSLGTSSEAVKSTTTSLTGTSRHTSHTDPLSNVASHPLSHGSLPPPPLPSEIKVGGDGSSDEGGQPSSGTPKATTIAAISGSTSGAVLLSVIVYFGIRACKRRRREQDAHVAGILTRGTNSSQPNLPGPAQSPSRGRTLTRAFRPPPLTGLHAPGAENEGRRGRTRAAFLSAVRGQISAPPPPALSTTDLPPARAPEDGEDGGHSSAVQWRPGDRAGAALCPPSPRSPWGGGAPAPANPAATAQPASLGDRAWHRRRLSTPYAPPTIPLPPTPPIVRQKKLAAAMAAAAGAGHRPLAPSASGARTPTAPPRPDRKQTVTSFETGSPGRRTPPHAGRDAEAAPPPPHLEFLPSTTYLADREPTVPVLPPITAGARMEFGAPGWHAGEVSPATTVDTDILYSPPTPRGGGGVGKGAKERGGRL